MIPQNEGLDDSSPDRGSNRGFGVVFAIFFTLVGFAPLLDGGAVRLWSVVVGGGVLLCALFFPSWLSPLNTLWHRLGLGLGKITTPVIMGMLFFVVVSPIGILLRLAGKDPLGLRPDPEVSSYWVHREPPGPTGESLRNQF